MSTLLLLGLMAGKLLRHDVVRPLDEIRVVEVEVPDKHAVPESLLYVFAIQE